MQRLKIAQQIIIVLLLAVLIPFITIGVIIANNSQQMLRRELGYSAKSISQFIGENIEDYLGFSQKKLDYIANALTFMPFAHDKAEFLTLAETNDNDFKTIEIIPLKDIPKDAFSFDKETSTIKITSKINDEYALQASLDAADMQNKVSLKYKDEKREIYIINSQKAVIATNTDNAIQQIELISELPQQLKTETPEFFNKQKNRPASYYTLEKPDWTVIVNTPEKVTNSTIDRSRYRIVLSLLLAALFIFTIVGIYTFYLYINIRQLFKGIIAISKGSYERKIHLLKSAFTPYELVFLAKEFNNMANKISQSYGILSEKNLELERLNEFRTNLVNAISHEFRTPLTSIVGYTSRLLRQDIKIDEQTKIKSLKVIRQQAQRLSRMVEDILVVPEIESFSIKLNRVELNLSEMVENSILYASADNSIFDLDISPDVKEVYADNDRLEQILINLCDNAVKYKIGEEKILITAKNIEDKPTITIKNKTLPIPEDMQEKIFDKFIRTDSNLTRTTRGTGLGLYIVKGLCATMNIDIELDCTDKDIFAITLVFNDYIG